MYSFQKSRIILQAWGAGEFNHKSAAYVSLRHASRLHESFNCVHPYSFNSKQSLYVTDPEKSVWERRLMPCGWRAGKNITVLSDTSFRLFERFSGVSVMLTTQTETWGNDAKLLESARDRPHTQLKFPARQKGDFVNLYCWYEEMHLWGIYWEKTEGIVIQTQRAL